MRKSVALAQAIHRLRADGATYAEIARACRCSMATVGRYLHPDVERGYRLREEGRHTPPALYPHDQEAMF